jgi:hypothetical protein
LRRRTGEGGADWGFPDADGRMDDYNYIQEDVTTLGKIRCEPDLLRLVICCLPEHCIDTR